MDFTRREFIQLAGGLLGGILLTGCGNGSNTPSGYRFFRLKSSGDRTGSLDNPLTIAEFGGSVHLSDAGVITFDAHDAEGRHGLFQLNLDLSQPSPLVYAEDTALISGETLEDGRTVREFSAHDVDHQGNIAAILQATNSGKQGHFGSGLYYRPLAGDFTPLLTNDDELDEGATKISGHFGDVALCADNGLLVVASHLPMAAGASSGRSLIHLPDPTDVSSRNRLLGVNDYLNDTDHLLQGFGILDIGRDGTFAVSAHSTAAASATGTAIQATEAGDETTTHHCLISGHLLSPNDHFLLAAPPSLNSSVHSGHISYGPRVMADGTVCTKIGGYGDADVEALILGEQVIRRTDQPGPAGEYAASFTPGSVAADGSYYYSQYVENSDDTVSLDLLMYDGTAHHVLLSVGDLITNVGSTVANIIFSTTTNHLDADNRLVLLCQFADNTTGLVIGIPV